MKKVCYCLFVCLLIVFFVGCDNSNIAFSATIESVYIAGVNESQGSIMVSTVKWDTSESQNLFDKASVGISKETKISFSDGTKATINNLSQGMEIEITFDGVVMESYPVQIRADRIIIKK